MSSLHGAAFHRGYAEWPRLAVFLQNKYSPKRKGRITPPLQRRYRVGLCHRCFPRDAVHTGGVLAFIFSHPLDGQCFAAKRVGQQPLQGFHLVVPAALCCLHNTRLQPPYLTLSIGPIDAMPRHARRCTRPCCCFHLRSSREVGSTYSLVKRDHKEVCPLSRRVMSQPLSVPLPNGVRFFLNPVPAPPQADLAACCLRREPYGVSTFHLQKYVGLGGCFRPRIAVGIPVTRYPPHRSQRAQFTHWAPTLGE